MRFDITKEPATTKIRIKPNCYSVISWIDEQGEEHKRTLNPTLVKVDVKQVGNQTIRTPVYDFHNAEMVVPARIARELAFTGKDEHGIAHRPIANIIVNNKVVKDEAEAVIQQAELDRVRAEAKAEALAEFKAEQKAKEFATAKEAVVKPEVVNIVTAPVIPEQISE